MSNTTLSKEELVEALSNLSVLELAELKDMLKDKWGVEASAPAVVGVAAAPAAGGEGAAEEEESSEFQVTLTEFPAAKKAMVIKAVREITGQGLRECKELVEGSPSVLKDSAAKDEAEEIKKKLEETGAKVTLKGL